MKTFRKRKSIFVDIIHYIYHKIAIILMYKLKIKEDAMGGACKTHGRDEKIIQHFGQKT